MNTITTSLIVISAVLVFTGVPEITSSQGSAEPFKHNAVLQQDDSQIPIALTWVEVPISTQANTAIADGQEFDKEISRVAQTALNLTRQMIITELNENVKAQYKDATLATAYHNAVLLTVEK